MLGTWAIVAHHSGVQSVSNLTLYTIEGTGTDEEYLLGIDLNHLLVRMLAPTLRGYIHYRPFKELKQPLLYSLSADISSDGGVIPLTSDLIDLINENNPPLSSSYIVVCHLKQSGK